MRWRRPPASWAASWPPAGAEAVETGAIRLALGAGERLDALVHLDTHDDILLVEQGDERLAVLSLLADGFVEHDGAADVVVELRAGEEDLAVRTAVLLRVLDTDRSETLANSTVGLVRRENTLAAARDSLGGGRQLVAELGARAAGEGYSGTRKLRTSDA